MRFFRLKPFAAPKRFCFKDPDTGFMYLEPTKAELIRRIVAYRAQNGLEPIEHIGMVLENYWCTLPENVGAGQFGPNLKRGFMGYVRGGVTLLKYVMIPNPVPQAQAERRAEICEACPGNVFPDKGPFMMWTDNIAIHTVGDLRTRLHDFLGNCEGCTCVLKAKVWFPAPFSLTPEEEARCRSLNLNCWQLPQTKAPEK
jgi:hypothetical protein